MKLVFVNPSHPEMAHVSSMRLPLLARELARRGHQVLLFTSTLSEGDRASLAPRDLAPAIARHDWSLPLHVAVPPRRDAVLRAVRDGSLPAFARRAITFYYQVRHLGVFEDWASSFEPYVDALAAAWAPDAVWGTFGNTSSLKLTRRFARRCGAPWLIDFKDSWREFVHPQLRSYFAWRFRDASAATANAVFTRDVAREWFVGLETTLVYSGVVEAFFERPPGEASEPANELVLIGGIYSEQRLREFLAALQAWLVARAPSAGERVRLVYLGSDAAKVRKLVAEVDLACDVDVQSFVNVAEMARRCRRAFACCYIKSDMTFHHKLLELLVSGRPVICYPAETEESLGLSRSFRNPLLSCASAAELAEAFSTAWRMRGEPAIASERAPFSWASRAAELEAVFASAIARPR